MKATRVVLYDGYCQLCSRTVRWIKRNDRKGRFSFKPLSEEASAPEEASSAETVVLLEKGKRFERSTAAIRITMGLRFPWPLLAVLYIVPRFVRDVVYNWIARNRKRWFGEHSTCYLPED
jgi:predicted DCC family thiol-disulfide oxidoreductase YuxK